MGFLITNTQLQSNMMISGTINVRTLVCGKKGLTAYRPASILPVLMTIIY